MQLTKFAMLHVLQDNTTMLFQWDVFNAHSVLLHVLTAMELTMLLEQLLDITGIQHHKPAIAILDNI